MNVYSQISVLKIVENEETWLINVGEDQHMRNNTFDRGGWGYSDRFLAHFLSYRLQYFAQVY